MAAGEDQEQKDRRLHPPTWRHGVRFLASFIAAALFWYSVKLLEDYTTVVTLPVAYENLPPKVKLSRKLPKELRVKLSGKGHDLLLRALQTNTDTARIDINRYFEREYVPESDLRAQLQRHLPANSQIVDVSPDSLMLAFEQKVTRLVPLRSLVSVKPQNGYVATSPLRLSPDSALIIGARSEVDSVEFWPTQTALFSNIRADFKSVVPLERSQELVVSPDEIIVSQEIRRFTERSVKVRVEVINEPINSSLRLLRDSATVKFLLPFESYEQYAEEASELKVVVDFNKLDRSSPFVAPELRGLPVFARGVRVIPPYFRYVISSRQTQ